MWMVDIVNFFTGSEIRTCVSPCCLCELVIREASSTPAETRELNIN